MNDSMNNEERIGRILAEEYEEVKMDAVFRQDILSRTKSVVISRNRTSGRWMFFFATGAVLVAVLTWMISGLFTGTSPRTPMPGSSQNHAVVPSGVGNGKKTPEMAVRRDTSSVRDGSSLNRGQAQKTGSVSPGLVADKKGISSESVGPQYALGGSHGTVRRNGLMADIGSGHHIEVSRGTKPQVQKGNMLNLAVIALQQPVMDASGRELKLGEHIFGMSSVQTGKGGRLGLVTRRGTQLFLDSNTRVALSSGMARIEKGRMYCSNRMGEIKRIDTPGGQIHLLGTVLDTAILSDNTAAVTVVEGKVKLVNRHGSALVPAGRKSVLMASYSPEEGLPVDTAAETGWYDGRGKIVSESGEISYLITRPGSNLSEIWTMSADGSDKHRIKSYLGYMNSTGQWLSGDQWLQVDAGSLLWTTPNFVTHQASAGAGHPIVNDTAYVLNAVSNVDQTVGLPKEYRAIYTALSPDARYLAFTGYFGTKPGQKPEGGLYLYDLLTGSVKHLMGGYLKTPPSWSPNGRFVAVSAGEDYGTDHPLVLVNVENCEVIHLNAQGAAPVVSPDGKRVAFCGDFKEGGSWYRGVPQSGSILVQDIGTSVPAMRISPEGEGAIEPNWSPDGTRVLYMTNKVDWSRASDNGGSVTQEFHIFVAQADGSGVKEIYQEHMQNVGIIGAAWSADGSAVYVRRPGGLLLVSPDGSGVIADLGGNPEDSTMSREETQQTVQASAAVEEAAYQFSLGNVRRFEGKAPEASAAFRRSADIFGSLPWKYPLAGISIRNSLDYADAASVFAAKDDETTLADACKDRMGFLSAPFHWYHSEEKGFPADLRTLEDWSLNFGGQVNWLSLKAHPEWARLLFCCPGTPTSGPVPYIYTKPADPKAGDIIVTCPNHPQNKVVVEQWWLR